MREKVLKAGWKIWRFDQMATSITDRIDNPAEADVEHYVGLEHLDTDSLKIRRWGVPTDVEATKLRFRKSDIIFGRRRVYQRKVGVAEFDGICSAHALVLRPKTDVILPEFLPFFMQSDLFMNRALEISVGSLSPTINWRTLASQEFALPPMEEQRRIARLIQCSQETVQSSQHALGSLRSLRRVTIDTLCQKQDGKIVRLRDVCEMQNGRPFPGTEYQKTGGIPLLRPGNLGIAGYLDWNADKTVRLPERFEQEALDFVIKPGDIVINLTAQSLEDGFMGRVCIAREGDHSLLNQRIGRFVFSSKEIHPQYFFRVLQTSRFQQHIVSMCEGTKVKHLYWRHLEKFDFSLPTFDRQQMIANILTNIDKSLDTLSDRRNQQQILHACLLNESLNSAKNEGILRSERHL